MKKQPIGYLPLCEGLLNEGVPVSMIKKHRFVLQALAAGMYAAPVDIDHDQLGFTFAIENAGRFGERRAEYRFNALSGIATVAREIQDGGPTIRFPSERLSMISALGTTLWVFPVEDDFTWWERLRIWIEARWLALKAKAGKKGEH